MSFQRREFLKLVAAGAGCTACGPASGASSAPPADSVGMLVDLHECIGCRKCEWACAQENKLSDAPLTSYEDTSVFESPRRMKADAYTVVNRYPGVSADSKPVYSKVQCMHCLHPACVSACIVGALRRQPNGVVSYDAKKCIGCRYCMVACPFQVPAYEYENTLTPQVRKCVFCANRIESGNKIPACAEMCPPMAITFGKRDELLKLAHRKIAEHPGRYVDRVYGEREAGGTAWLYLAPKPFDQLDFLEVGEKPIPELTETLQHSIFRYGVPPMLLFGLLAAAMRAFRHDENPDVAEVGKDSSS